MGVGTSGVWQFLAIDNGVGGLFLANGDDGGGAIVVALLVTFDAPGKFNVNLSPP